MAGPVAADKETKGPQKSTAGTYIVYTGKHPHLVNEVGYLWGQEFPEATPVVPEPYNGLTVEQKVDKAKRLGHFEVFEGDKALTEAEARCAELREEAEEARRKADEARNANPRQRKTPLSDGGRVLPPAKK